MSKNRFAVRKSIAEALKKLETKRGIRMFREEDELPDDQYFIQIPTLDLPPEIKVDGDVVNVGPFDSPEDAQAAAGTDDVAIVNDEGTPVIDVDNHEGDEEEFHEIPGEAPAAMEARRKKFEAKKRSRLEKKLKEEVDRDIKEAEDKLDVRTTVGGSDSATFNGSGNYGGHGASKKTNATPADGTQVGKETSAPAERRPDTNDKNNRTPGAENATSTGGTLDGNGGGVNWPPETASAAELDANGGDVKEGISNDSWLNAYVRVTEKKSGQQVDTGLVTKKTPNSIHVEDNEYSFDDYTIMRLG